MVELRRIGQRELTVYIYRLLGFAVMRLNSPVVVIYIVVFGVWYLVINITSICF